MGPMSDLMARRVVITIHCDRFNPEFLQRNQHLLTEFSGAKEHDPGGRGRKRCT